MPENDDKPIPRREGSEELSSLLEKLTESLRPSSKPGRTLLDTGQVTQTEEVRLSLRKDCKESLYFLARGVLRFKDLVPHVHLPVCQHLTNWSTRRKVLELPRGHFKSTCASIALPTWMEIQALYGNSWNSLSVHRLHLLQRSNTSANAELFLQDVRNLWDTNDLLRWVFPELCPGPRDVWTNARIWINRTVTRLEDGAAVPMDFRVDALGTGGSAVSRHFDGIIDDDLVDEDEADSETQMAKVIREHQRSESLFVEPAVGRHWLVGTRWSYFDLLYHVVQTEPDIDHYLRPAEDLTDIEEVVYGDRRYYVGRPMFPERFTRLELARIMHKQGPYIYSCFYRLNPVPDEEQVFKPEWLRKADTYPPGLKKVFCADPAISQKKTADFTGLAGIGVGARGSDTGYDIYIFLAKRKRFLPNELIHEMYELTELYQPSIFGFEDVGFQRAYQYPIQLLRPRYPREIPFQLVKWPGKASKEARIKSMQPYFASGQVILVGDLADLKLELLTFPHGVHDDILDALAYAIYLAFPEGQVHVEPPPPPNEWAWEGEPNASRCVMRTDAILDEIEKRHQPESIDALLNRAWIGHA